MPMIEMAQSTDVNTIRDLSIATFAETFASLNTEEDMEQYNERHFSTDELQREIDNPDSTFVVAKVDGDPAGYMKVNVGDAQTEEMLGNRMEVQRLYILRQYKRNGLGTRFMHTAFDMARAQGKSVIWLGYGSTTTPRLRSTSAWASSNSVRMTLCWERTGRRTCSWKRPWTGLCSARHGRMLTGLRLLGGWGCVGTACAPCRPNPSRVRRCRCI